MLEQDSRAVDVDHLMGLLELCSQRLDYIELLFIGTIDPDLRRAKHLRHVCKLARQRQSGVAEYFDQSRAGVDSIVVAEVAIREEKMTAHLTRHRGIRLLHL